MRAGSAATDANAPALVDSRGARVNSAGLVTDDRVRSEGALPRVRPQSRAPLAPPRLSLMSTAGAPVADPERAFVDHLNVIDQVIAAIARRHALTSSEADEFGSWAKSRIIDSDYAVFRKFGGRSSMATYLSAVFGHLFLDYRNSIWGRWRPSSAAVRLGPVGIRLDELLHRDGYTLREAREVLRSAGAEQSDIEISRMAAQLPSRQTQTEVPLETLGGTAHEAARQLVDVGSDDDGLHTLREALTTLPPEDQVIMRMRFWDDTSVADIARLLRIDQKPLYRRIEAIEVTLRGVLTTRGIDKERARDLLSNEVVW
jgi:RNA polymerase sigma factor (sigma-70 family)